MKGVSRTNEGYCLSINTTIYALPAIKKAAYKFADRTAVTIEPAADCTVLINFHFVGAHKNNNPEQVISDFCNELLDQDLREIVKQETEPLRNFILAHAFSKTTLSEKGQN